jgi:hypothetical protein
MATSTIPSFVASLRDQWQAALDAASIEATVTVGPPKPGQKLGRVWVLISGVKDWSQEYRGLPAGAPSLRKAEEYRVEVLVDVLRSSRDQVAVNSEAFDVVAELETLLAAAKAPWYSGPGQLVSAEVSGGKGLDMRASNEDREAALEVEVTVTARI